MEFIDPPPNDRTKRSEEWVERVRLMRENRGEWAKVGTYSPAVATFIRRGNYKAFLEADSPIDPAVYMKQHWEVTTRSVGDSRQDVFVRWLG
jgi:hypothetical protein